MSIRVGQTTNFQDASGTVRTGTVDMICTDGSYVVTPTTSEPSHKAGTNPRRRRVVVKDNVAVRFEGN